jgi:hypothetical protein
MLLLISLAVIVAMTTTIATYAEKKTQANVQGAITTPNTIPTPTISPSAKPSVTTTPSPTPTPTVTHTPTPTPSPTVTPLPLPSGWIQSQTDGEVKYTKKQPDIDATVALFSSTNTSLIDNAYIDNIIFDVELKLPSLRIDTDTVTHDQGIEIRKLTGTFQKKNTSVHFEGWFITNKNTLYTITATFGNKPAIKKESEVVINYVYHSLSFN